MPWTTGGEFVRTNNQFSGADVWQDDQQAAIKIIASRHDFHDEDLANGIQQSLNTSGYNKMLADLDMNGFSVVNAANAGFSGDWTPTLSNGVTTLSNHGGSYIRLGRLVIAFADINYANNPQDSGVIFTIGALPFNIAVPTSGSARQYPATFAAWDNIDLSGSSNIPQGTAGQLNNLYTPEVFTRQIDIPTVGADGKTISIWRYIGANDLSNPDTLVELTQAFLTTTGEFSFTYIYLTDDPVPTT